ncbi:PPA1309 family protein [Nocardioides sp. InS609-2]|uniref:PPA1309 family protein n=1 Tax=Nocardioides sp. InS609-2 TaxID=2760705 RepID=UPI0020BE5FF1|nr:PPA1309 family protein [Nocardioides sp. InS609-2]
MTDLPEGLNIELPSDPALATAVLEIEVHAATSGWDQKSRLYALVDTRRLVDSEPGLAASMGLDDSAQDGSFTAIEQDDLPPGQQLERVLEEIVWPPTVVGCAAVVERLVLPPDVDAEIPDDPGEAARFAAEHPLRQEVRIVAGATRAGATYSALRLRAHDDDQSVVDGTELVPGLLQLLLSTFDDITLDEELS